MAWQHAANMGGNGGSPAGGGSETANPAANTQGTEYTLQGEHYLMLCVDLPRNDLSRFLCMVS